MSVFLLRLKLTLVSYAVYLFVCLDYNNLEIDKIIFTWLYNLFDPRSNH